MIEKLYWTIRILGYLACLGGIFYYLAQLQDLDSRAANTGLFFVYGGFVAFFISYALRAWLRFGPRRQSEDRPVQ